MYNRQLEILYNSTKDKKKIQIILLKTCKYDSINYVINSGKYFG